MLFQYPEQAAFKRVVPKSKVYENSRVSNTLKKLFVDQVGKIVWKYKLSADTINLPGRPEAPEIQIFEVVLKAGSIKEDVLRCIDNAIAFPIFFELVFQGKVQGKAAYKRPSEADSKKWVVDSYFETDWLPVDTARSPLPVALDLGSLYEKMMHVQIGMPACESETLRDQVARIGEIRAKEIECGKMQKRLDREKQYNRRVDLNSQVRELKQEIKRLEK